MRLFPQDGHHEDGALGLQQLQVRDHSPCVCHVSGVQPYVQRGEDGGASGGGVLSRRVRFACRHGGCQVSQAGRSKVSPKVCQQAQAVEIEPYQEERLNI